MKATVLFLIISLCTFFVQAAVKVSATVDRPELGMGDTVTLSVTVQSDESVRVEEPRVPNLNGLKLVQSSQDSAESNQMVTTSSGMKFVKMYRQNFNYILTPEKAGRVTIPGFELNVDGKTYTTQPIKLQIDEEGSGAAQMPPGFPNMDQLDEDDEIFNQFLRNRGQAPNPSREMKVNPNEAFFIHADVDKTDVYEGEQIVVNWYIYTRGNLMSLDRLKFPDLKGFWKEIIEEVPALNFTQEVVNGIPYRRALLASHALFPIKPGVAIIDEYKIKAQVQIPTSPFGAFGFGRPYTFSKSSERIKVNVKPLPVEGKPNNFSGAVGQFEVRAHVEGNQFPVNQPFSLKVRFEGNGNAKLIELPSLGLPKGVEIYDTKSDAKFFKSGNSFKEFDVLLIPREEGSLQIPAMSFSIFDPVQKKYVTKTTEPITVQIVANPGGAASGKDTSFAPGKEEKTAAPVEKKNQLPDVLVSWDRNQGDSFSDYKILLWTAIYLFIFVLLGWKARRAFGWGQKQKDLRAELQKRFKKIHAKIDQGQWREAGTELTNAIYQVLGAVSGQGGATLEINKLLDQAPPSLRRELGAELARLIDVCQILSFAPEAVVGKLKEPAELKKHSKDIEKTLLQALKLAENKTES
jgi:hypothetical protein